MSPSADKPAIIAPSLSIPREIPSCSSNNDLLPHEFKIVATKNFRETAGAIHDMVVRGAGAIGATAAYGLAQGALAFRGNDLRRFHRHIEAVYQTLKTARPTAVDPVNAMNGVCAAKWRGAKLSRKNNSSRWPPPRNLPNEDVAHCEAIGQPRREIDSPRRENSHALQRRLAGICGHRHGHRADVCRAGTGQKISCLLRRNPSAFARRDTHRVGTGAAKNFRTKSSPTTPPAI